jgi:NAD(P)H-dependent FMN reductase
MKVAILVGSTREGRQSHKIAYYLEEEMLKKNICTDIIDLGKKAAMIPELYADPYPAFKDEMNDIRTRVQEADALVLVTPEYHGSFSGVLKIALDNLGTEFHRKTVGVVTVSSGKLGGVAAAVQLQHVVLSMGGYALPCKLLVPDVQTAFDDSCRLISERTIKSAAKFIDEYIWFSNALYEKKYKGCKYCSKVSI